MKFKRLKNGDKFQFVDSHHSMAEYEKVDTTHYRLVGIGALLEINQCPKGDNEPVASQHGRKKR
jgi:predicted glycoside hydrolase/deacetylase ChbG (UPF0249 family)